ncbi:MAG: flagellar motor switch protein FliN [Thermodesulfobacteriota bacterium]|nr:flagellar motor switch protein FliN [Thermodesulfobacteriota bacterium]
MADKSLDDSWADALEESNEGSVDNKEEKVESGASEDAEFAELGNGKTSSSGERNLDFLLDLPLKVTVELGRNTMLIDKMLQMTQGSVIELEKAAGEPVEIFVNNKLLGKGEVIVVNDRFGVRITEIISQADRIKNMS